jgi:hypothetical protein
MDLPPEGVPASTYDLLSFYIPATTLNIWTAECSKGGHRWVETGTESDVARCKEAIEWKRGLLSSNTTVG